MLANSQGRKIILTDIDGVMLDWMDGFSKFLYAKYGWTEIEGSEKYYSVMDRFVELDKVHQVIELVTQFNNSDEFGYLDPFADSIAGLNALRYSLGDSFVFVPITQIGNTPRACQLRQENLSNIFGADVFDFDLMHAFDLSEGKHRAFTKWQDSGVMYIDDHAKHCQHAHEHGLNTYMFGTTYNTEDSIGGVMRVNNWVEWVEAIKTTLFANSPEEVVVA